MSNIKTVVAFEKLLGYITGYGGKYNPGSPNLHVNALTNLLSQARQAINETHIAKTGFDNATNARELTFRDLAPLCPRIMNALKASGASALTVADAQAHVRKLTGKRRPVLPTAVDGDPAKAKPRTRTARGLDYGSKADHFAKLVETVSAFPGYQPNETELSIASLKSFLDSLREANKSVNAAIFRLTDARSNRGSLLYNNTNNVTTTGTAVKYYIRSAFGTRSPEATEISRIKFFKVK